MFRRRCQGMQLPPRPARRVNFTSSRAKSRSGLKRAPSQSRRGQGSWVAFGDQSGAALPGEIGPEPLPLHPEPVLQLRQRHQMQEDPDEPCGEPAHANAPALQNREIFADDGHIALIEISERTFRLMPVELARDQASDIASLLDRRLRDAGHRAPLPTTDEASPTTNTPAAPSTSMNGPTAARPALSVLPPSCFTSGDGATPAVQITVALGIRVPLATTPFSSTCSTLTPVIILTPSFSSLFAALPARRSENVGRIRAPPSIRMIALSAASIRRYCPRSVSVAICAMDAASSTPVGPAPTRRNVIRARVHSHHRSYPPAHRR